MGDTEEFVCINCLQPSESLCRKYSTDVIRLTECKKCGGVVDKYVEYDNVLIVIDLIIHYMTAYRHILYNMKSLKYLRLFVIFLFCDAYDKWIGERGTIQDSTRIHLELIFYKSMAQSTLEISVFIGLVLLYEILTRSKMRNMKFIAQSTLVGYYGNVAVVLSIVFHLSDELSYRTATRLFIFLSHVQTQRALFPNDAVWKSIAVVSVASVLAYTAGFGLRYFLL